MNVSSFVCVVSEEKIKWHIDWVFKEVRLQGIQIIKKNKNIETNIYIYILENGMYI